jgi:hypothetical protein
VSDDEKQRSKSIITVQGKKIASEFEPFYDKIKALKPTEKNFKIFRKSYFAFVDRWELSHRLLEIGTKGLIEYREEAPDTTVIYMHPFYYLGFVESEGNTITNMIVMILVASGIDFHLIKGKWRVKHIISFKELEKERIPLNTKLNFLREHGMKEFSNAVDNELRNLIAHMNFQVEGNEIYVRGKPIDTVVAKGYGNLLWALLCMEKFIYQLAEETGLAKAL